MRVGILVLIAVVIAPQSIALAEARANLAPTLLVAEADTGCGPGGDFEGEDSPNCKRKPKCFFGGLVCPPQPAGPDGPFYRNPDLDRLLKDIMTRPNEVVM